jgi:titin
MILSNILCALKKSPTSKVRHKERGRYRPEVELLEDRTAPAVFTVNTISDFGAGTLREAITRANATLGADTINFAIGGAGVKTIQPFSPLPVVTEKVTFAGETQGASATPPVQLNGLLAGPSCHGLVLKAAGCVVRSLAINGFAGNGILVLRPGCIVQGCHIGTNPGGTVGVPNQLHGILITGTATDVRIGGTASGQGNVISANVLAGVAIQGALVSGNVVQGNRIGTDLAGAADLGNGLHGVLISGGAKLNVIGGTVSGVVNVISGNDGCGVGIFDVGTTGNKVQGNLIGTTATGANALPNSLDGVMLERATGNTIGGATAIARNVISANTLNGVNISTGATGNFVLGNYIGTDASGFLDLGNGTTGVNVAASNNTIGGAVLGARNLISGNATFGILISGPETAAAGPSTTGVVVQGNFIGTNASGTGAIPNLAGVELYLRASKNTIGGTVAGARNVISGNSIAGVIIAGDDAISLTARPTGNLVLGNYIGTNAAGTSSLGNGGAGVLIQTADTNTIGGTVAGARNVIANSPIGVQIRFGATDNQIQGNYIGTNAAGNAALGNTTGIEISSDAFFNIVGGTVIGAGNVISGNSDTGILITGGGTSDTRVQGNRIGTNAAGNADLGNGLEGVKILGGTFSNIVGGTTPAARNVISGNNRVGVFIANPETSGNDVQGNYIGLAANGVTPLGNSNCGVYISDQAFGNMIGGFVAGAGNVIAHNGGDGVLIGLDPSIGPTSTPADFGNSVLRNRIFSNAEHGIDLGNDDGATPNDSGDTDTGPNALLNKPVLTSAFLDVGMLHITGFLDAENVGFAFRIEFFANATGGQGQTFLGSVSVPPGNKVAFSTALAVPASVLAGQTLTATLTDVLGNTSEFSIPLTIV